VLHFNGQIYGIPFNDNRILVINPNTNTATTWSDSNIGTADLKVLESMSPSVKAIMRYIPLAFRTIENNPNGSTNLTGLCMTNMYRFPACKIDQPQFCPLWLFQYGSKTISSFIRLCLIILLHILLNAFKCYYVYSIICK